MTGRTAKMYTPWRRTKNVRRKKTRRLVKGKLFLGCFFVPTTYHNSGEEKLYIYTHSITSGIGREKRLGGKCALHEWKNNFRRLTTAPGQAVCIKC